MTDSIEARRGLTQREMEFLRLQNALSDGEIAYLLGDLLIAEAVITGQKRVLGEHAKILANSRRVLHG